MITWADVANNAINFLHKPQGLGAFLFVIIWAGLLLLSLLAVPMFWQERQTGRIETQMDRVVLQMDRVVGSIQTLNEKLSERHVAAAK